ncbi:2-dehydropantoate 2-reductase [Gallaecimonas kandeliae]|uniref:ketopantoate reductase family protein n=1 Tax=Gallaecimonas kandeliae TaxID=3029055 RepID=UPI002649C2AD|nr:2-dehydropantoate 2-reductase [Gallaecimonas kandeliae]WKE64901.1 2-dehydropantoate 2-reductase [Gallaecimonas kandeliae]
MATIGVLGDGAIGRLVAGRLRRQDQQVILKGRSGLAPSADLWLICTKSHQALAAVQALAPAPELPLVLLCNGLGPHEQLAEAFPNPLFLATTTYGARRQGEQVVMTGHGQCWYGHFKGSKAALPLVHSVLNLAMPPATCFADVLKPLWRKLAINAVINPLTARDQVTNGALLEEDYRVEIHTLVHEMQPVLAAEGVVLGKEELLAAVLAVAKATAANHSSMLEDRRLGRKTEIDAISGYLCEKAEEHGLLVPSHRQLWQEIRELNQ